MKRILFVDDEPQILEGLQRMLRPRRHEWEMVFAPGGEEALRALEAEPFDVIVSDMRMPGMDGATLLRRVQERHPDVARIVLSGHTELEAALRAIPVAHQFLTKPCEADTLTAVVERACGLQAVLGDEHLRRVVGEVQSLPTLPRVYAALNEKLADPDASFADVARLIERDTGICAKVLQLVNSPLIGLSHRVSAIPQAVNLLGTRMLQNVVLCSEVFRSFPTAHRARGFSPEALQAHAYLAASIARRIVTDRRLAEDAFVAAMLHDIGLLVLAYRLPERLQAVLAAAHAQRAPLVAVESADGSVTHAEIGAYLLGLWGLPYPIVEAVAHHHAPARVPHQRSFDLVAAVHVADHLAHEQTPGDPLVAPSLDLAHLEALGVAGELPAWRAIAAEQANAAAAA